MNVSTPRASARQSATSSIPERPTPDLLSKENLATLRRVRLIPLIGIRA